MKSYALFLSLPLLGVWALNYTLDAGNLRATDTTRELAAQQSAATVTAAPDQLDHRSWVRERLLRDAAAGKCPDVLLTGSSTVSKLSAEMFDGMSFFNAFLAGPSPEDLEALTSLMRATSCWPKAIVVGLDPWWIANPASESRRWVTWADDYLAYDEGHRGAGLRVRAELGWSAFEERLNFTTTRESIQLFLRNRKGNPTRLIDATPESLTRFCTSSALGGHYIRAIDGHAVECTNLLASPEEREQAAESYVNSNPHAMGEWRELDHGRLAELQRVAPEWAAHAGRVVLLAPAYHPVTFQKLTEHPRIGPNLQELDAQLTRMTGEHVRFLNLRDPSTIGCTRDEFLDSHHGAIPCARKLAARIVAELR